MRVDVHQHLWNEELLAALARRSAAPRAEPTGEGWWLELPTESRCTVPADSRHDRSALLAADGLDTALVAASPALGIDALPGEEAEDLLAAHRSGLAAPFHRWATLPLREAQPLDVDAALAGGAVGLCLPAGALATPGGWERAGPLLERLARRRAPLFVHPGPDPWAPATPPAAALPTWWPAMTDYVAGLHAAWHAWLAAGAVALPDLRVVWAALAGGAPLHLERLAARGGPARRAHDVHSFYDTSSYGVRAVDAMVRVVGIDQLLFGSDRPVVQPWAPPGPLGEAAWEAMTFTNPARALKGAPAA